MRLFYALLDLLIGSPVDFIFMLAGGEILPKWPDKFDFDEISDGSVYHKAKGYWSEVIREDGEWWSKFIRFVLWWEIVGAILLILL